MPTHNEQLQKIHDIIAAQLKENAECLDSGWKRSEQFVLLSNQEVFLQLQSMMSDLGQELFGDSDGQEQTQQVPDRNVSKSNNISDGENSIGTSWIGDFSC